MSLNSIIKDLKAQYKNSKLITRFAPSPNYYCTLGHLKGLYLLDQLVNGTKGILLLRFDDTDPSVAYKKEYYNSFLNVINNSAIRISKITRSCSNSIYLDAIKKLQLEDRVYYCDCGNKTISDTERCNCFEKRKETKIQKLQLSKSEVSGVFRFISNNPKQRDYVIYRKKDTDWSPTIALQGPVDDYRSKVNFILRGRDLESLTRRQKQVYEVLYRKPYPRTEYWGRISLCNDRTKKVWPLSKTEFLKKGGTKFPSLTSLLDLGYTWNTLRKFLLSYGLTKNDIKCDISKLNYFQCSKLKRYKLRTLSGIKFKELRKENSFYFFVKKDLKDKRKCCYWNSKTKTVVCYDLGKKKIYLVKN